MVMKPENQAMDDALNDHRVHLFEFEGFRGPVAFSSHSDDGQIQLSQDNVYNFGADVSQQVQGRVSETRRGGLFQISSSNPHISSLFYEILQGGMDDALNNHQCCIIEYLGKGPCGRIGEITECTSRYQRIIPDFRSEDSKNDSAKQASGYMSGGKRLPRNLHKPWWYGLENRLVFLTTSRRDVHRRPLRVTDLRAYFDESFPDVVESIWLENADYPLYGWLLLYLAYQVGDLLGDSPPRELWVPPRFHSVWLKRPHFTYQY